MKFWEWIKGLFGSITNMMMFNKIVFAPVLIISDAKSAEALADAIKQLLPPPPPEPKEDGKQPETTN